MRGDKGKKMRKDIYILTMLQDNPQSHFDAMLANNLQFEQFTKQHEGMTVGDIADCYGMAYLRKDNV